MCGMQNPSRNDFVYDVVITWADQDERTANLSVKCQYRVVSQHMLATISTDPHKQDCGPNRTMVVRTYKSLKACPTLSTCAHTRTTFCQASCLST